MTSPIPLSFTLDYNGVAREIITPAWVSVPLGPNVAKYDPRIHETTALWDTGATNCVITPKAAKALGLKPISVAKVNHAGGTSLTNVYLVDIYLLNNVRIQGVRVSECDDAAGSFGIIIGMDIISIGDFTISNSQNKTTISFRMPSMERIDYVKTHAFAHPRRDPTKSMPSIGRNNPCPCGSGKKYKHCCANN